MKAYGIENAVINRIGFKSQMSNLEIRGMTVAIEELAIESELMFSVDDLGLAYTSSSEYAMYNVCNGDFLYTPDWICISHFAVLVDGRPVMVCYDKDENEVFYILEG